jgi:hypothetical protein
MKLPMRTAQMPMPGSGAAKSKTSAMRRLRRTAKNAKAISTPNNPPWNDMPPSHTLNGYHGSSAVQNLRP